MNPILCRCRAMFGSGLPSPTHNQHNRGVWRGTALRLPQSCLTSFWQPAWPQPWQEPPRPSQEPCPWRVPWFPLQVPRPQRPRALPPLRPSGSAGRPWRLTKSRSGDGRTDASSVPFRSCQRTLSLMSISPRSASKKVGTFLGVGEHLDGVADHVQHAALLEAGAGRLVHVVDRDGDADLLSGRQALEVHMFARCRSPGGTGRRASARASLTPPTVLQLVEAGTPAAFLAVRAKTALAARARSASAPALHRRSPQARLPARLVARAAPPYRLAHAPRPRWLRNWPWCAPNT